MTTGTPGQLLARHQCAVCGLAIFRPTPTFPKGWRRLTVRDSDSREVMLDALVCSQGCTVRAVQRAQL